MSDLMNLAIIFFSGVVYASLQLGVGALLLLYHSSLSKNIKSRTKHLAGSFISGVGLMSMLLLLAASFTIYSLFSASTLSPLALSALIGALAALSLVMFLLYYRRGIGTELWLPKTIGNFVNARAKNTNSDAEAFSLGVATCFAELPISVIIFVLAGNSLLELNFRYQPLAATLFTVIAILPLIILRLAIRSGQTVVDVQKWRVKNKKFLRIVSGLAFAVLAIYIFTFKVIV